MNTDPTTALRDAIARKDAASVKTAILAGADVTQPFGDGFDLVSAALYSGSEILHAVLSAGVCPDLRLDADFYPIERAVIFKDVAAVKFLVECGASLGMVRNDDGETVLHRCACDGDFPTAEFLYRLADSHLLNQLNNSGESLLSFAIKRREFDTIGLLLTLGANVNPSLQGAVVPVVPLVVAVEMEDLRTIDLLLKHGASLTTPGWMGITPLMKIEESTNEAIRARISRVVDMKGPSS